MNYNEVLITDILKRSNCEIVDIEEMRKLFYEVKDLEMLIIESGRNKCGNNKCRVLNRKDVEKVLFNIVIRWNKMKLGM